MSIHLSRPVLGVTTAAILGCLLVTAAGCRPQDAIRQYTVPKEGGAVASTGEPQIMLAAIVPKDTPWAFKFQAKPEKVEQYREQFKQLVNSLSFAADGTPSWKLPEQWSEEEGNQFVYRAFRVQDDPKLRITISKLGLPFDPQKLDENSWRGYVVDNVNRWRGQLQLGEQGWEEMASDLEPIESLSAPKTPAYFVTLRGLSGGGSMGGPMSGAMGSAAAPMVGGPEPAMSKPSPSAKAKQSLVVKLPEGWQEVPPLNIMAMKSYEAPGTDGKKAAVTFIAAGGDRVSNVDRWNGQVNGAPEQTAKALEECVKLTVNDSPTEVFHLVGAGETPQAILAAKIDWSSQDALFVKMMGPAPVVEAQREAFIAMIKELKW